MNVTKANLAEACEQIEALLPSAAFVAIDEEMTGISLPGQPELVTDLPSRRYPKMRNVASRYSIIQFGICLFHEESGGGYVARPYNFYLFPEGGAVNMDSSSIGFLRDHNMDFNKWIYEGIPYVSSVAAKRLRSSLFPDDTNGKTASGDPAKRTPMVLTKAADIEITDKAISGIRDWLADESKKDETEHVVLMTNPYIRRFLYQSVHEKFPELLAESRPEPHLRGKSTFVVLRLNAEQKAEREAKNRAAKELEYQQKLGFYRVFTALSEAKKPLIGHNCMYDLLFMMSHFDGPLPESYASFQESLTGRFPVMLDTKLLATREPFKFKTRASPSAEGGVPEARENRFGSTALGEIFNVVQEEATAAKEAAGQTVQVSFAPAFDRYANDSSAAHEAGYDAYMTGYVFAHMAKEALKPECLPALVGRTPMFRSLFEFSLTGGEEAKVQDGVFVHVKGLTGCDASCVYKAFEEIKAPGEPPTEGAGAAPVQIIWINDDSAFAVLPGACTEAVAAMLGRSTVAGGLTLTPGEEWFKLQAEVPDGDPPAKRAKIS